MAASCVSALRLARRDGSHVFSEPSTDRSGAELLAAAAALGGRPEDRLLASRLLPGGKKKGGRAADLPAAAVHSEWAATAVLRPDWSPSAPRLTVVYADRFLPPGVGLRQGRAVVGPVDVGRAGQRRAGRAHFALDRVVLGFRRRRGLFGVGDRSR